jgi:hypothetical protein
MRSCAFFLYSPVPTVMTLTPLLVSVAKYPQSPVPQY